MPRRLVFAFAFTLAALAPATSWADGDCSDGWFCDEGAPAPTPAPSERPRPRDPGSSAPPTAIYDPRGYPPSSPPSGNEPGLSLETPDNPPAKRRHRRGYREWGFNLHFEAALLGNRRHRSSKAEMAGLGFGFRYRLLPPLAFEAGVDLLTGTDFQGYSRSEAGLLLNTLVFFNPHGVVQLYMLGGLGFSAARVTIAPRAGEAFFERRDQHYSYFGAQIGLGAEVRVTRRIAIAGDLIGFVRTRIDDSSGQSPEFIDPNTHRATNDSGAGLLRVGATFYW